MITATPALHRTSQENWYYFALGAVVLYFIVTLRQKRKDASGKTKRSTAVRKEILLLRLLRFPGSACSSFWYRQI